MSTLFLFSTLSEGGFIVEKALVRVHKTVSSLMRYGRRKSQIERYLDLESHPRRKTRSGSEVELLTMAQWM